MWNSSQRSLIIVSAANNDLLRHPLLDLQKLHSDIEFDRQIIFSDEAQFHLGAYVNKQNYPIWRSENPHDIVEKPMHPKKVIGLYGFWSENYFGEFSRRRKIETWIIFGFSRMAQYVAKLKKQSMFCALSSVSASSAVLTMLFVCLGAGIWLI